MKYLPACLAFVISAAAPTFAFADVPPSDIFGCASKTVNAACKNDGDVAGTCVAKKCNRLDYTPKEAGVDGAVSGGPSGSIEYDCLTCVAGSGATSTAKSGCVVAAQGADGAGLGVLGAGLALVAYMARRKRSR